MTLHTPSLFQFTATQWLSEPDTAFDAFLTEYSFAGRKLRPSSFVIYRGMFARLREWATEQGIELLAIQAPIIERFLNSRRLGPETRHRYLLFFTTLFEHLALVQKEEGDAVVEDENPARSLLMMRPAPLRADPELLNEQEVELFIASLPKGTKWKAVRDRALALMVLGAGLRSAEVLNLKLSDLVLKDDHPVAVWVQAHAPKPARKVPIHRWALAAIEEWLCVRAMHTGGNPPRYRGQEQRLLGNLLFPAGLGGGPLQAATLFRLVKATLQEAGIEKRYEGPTLLRNSCGALWLKHHSPQEVRLWMGHETLRTTELLIDPASRSHSSPARRYGRKRITSNARHE